MNIHRLGLSVVALLCTWQAFAQSHLHYTFGTVENLPPYSYTQNGRLQGIDIDFINALAERVGIVIEIRPMPWVRVIASLQKGVIDGAFSLYKVEERQVYCSYVDIMHYDNLGIAVKKGHEFSYKGVADLSGKLVGKGAGVFISYEFSQAVRDKKFRVEELNDASVQNIAKLKAERVDLVIGVVDSMLYYAKQLGFAQDIVIVDGLIQKKRPGYLVISKNATGVDNPQFINQLRKGIALLMEDGTYQRIQQKYRHTVQP